MAALVAKARIPPFIATLGTFTAIRGAANLYTGGRPISDLTDDYNFIGQGDVFGFRFRLSFWGSWRS